MIKFIKQLFCKHVFVRYWQTSGNAFYHKTQWYYDDWQVDYCSKCGKGKTVNPYGPKK